MLTLQFIKRTVWALPVFIVAGCGGSSSSTDLSRTAVTPAMITSFVTSYNQALSSGAGTSVANLVDLVDDSFLDGGLTKAQIQDAATQDAAAVAANPDSLTASNLYPLMALENASVTGCNETTAICQMLATYVTPTPDLTRVTATVQVRMVNGKLRLYGDQLAA